MSFDSFPLPVHLSEFGAVEQLDNELTLRLKRAVAKSRQHPQWV